MSKLSPFGVKGSDTLSLTEEGLAGIPLTAKAGDRWHNTEDDHLYERHVAGYWVDLGPMPKDG